MSSIICLNFKFKKSARSCIGAASSANVKDTWLCFALLTGTRIPTTPFEQVKMMRESLKFCQHLPHADELHQIARRPPTFRKIDPGDPPLVLLQVSGCPALVRQVFECRLIGCFECVETRLYRRNIRICACFNSADEEQIRINLDATCRNAKVLQVERHRSHAAKRIEHDIISGQAKMIGDVVGKMRRKARCQPIPAVNREAKFSLKRHCLGIAASKK